MLKFHCFNNEVAKKECDKLANNKSNDSKIIYSSLID